MAKDLSEGCRGLVGDVIVKHVSGILEELHNLAKERNQLRQQLAQSEARVASQHEQIREIHRVTSAIAEVKIEPADYSETLTVRRVKEMARLMNLMSGWIDDYKARIAELEADNLHQRERRNAARECIKKMGKSNKAAILRAQADAVERSALLFPGRDLTDIRCSLHGEAQRLRNQADELEKTGGSDA
jgi:alanyl-tRNA synthetase